MASQILSNVAEKAKSMTGEKSQKIADLSANTKDVHDPNYRITSDFGVKQTNTDDWLAVVSDDQQGPQLLEDSFGREKVCSTLANSCHCPNNCRFTASITNAFPSV
jgi:catalase